MKKIITTAVVFVFFIVLRGEKATAQIPIADIIKAGVKKVIKAVDLKIQRLQNKTIWLQNAQKTLENELSKLKLHEIGDWAKRQKELYGNYFDELYKVKSAISQYQAVRDIISKQSSLINEYAAAMRLSRQDRHFTAAEIQYMEDVYAGILEEAVKSIEQLQMVLTAFSTQMTDAKRLDILHTVADQADEQLADLRQFNQQNIRISLQRAKVQNDVSMLKKLYGL